MWLPKSHQRKKAVARNVDDQLSAKNTPNLDDSAPHSAGKRGGIRIPNAWEGKPFINSFARHVAVRFLLMGIVIGNTAPMTATSKPGSR